MASRAAPRASRVQVEGSVRDINDYYYEQGWTDGRPIIPPTEDLVLEMVEACSLSAGHSFGQMAPLNGSVTVEQGGDQLGYGRLPTRLFSGGAGGGKGSTATPVQRWLHHDHDRGSRAGGGR